MNKLTNMYRSHLGAAVVFLLKPLAKVLIKAGVGYAEFAQWAKFAFVEVAEKEFTQNDKAPSTSRVSILTGMHRKEVAKIRSELAEGMMPEKLISANRAERVINAWLREDMYLSDGEPRLLSLDKNADDGFQHLVTKFSGDIHPATVLDELMRIGAVEKVSENHIRLTMTGYLPVANSSEQLDVFGKAAHDLLATLSNNVDSDAESKRFQRTVAYQHLSPESVKAFKEYSEQENQKLLLKLNRWLAERDMSIAEQRKAPCQYRAGVGIYYFEEKVSGHARSQEDVN